MPPLNHAPWLGPTHDDDGNLQDNLAEDYTSLYQQSPQSISYDETNVPNRTRLELAMSRGERREVVRPARFADPPIFNELDGWRQEHLLWRNNPNLDPTPASRDAARAEADHQDRIRAYRANHQEEQAAARDFEKAISYLESLRVHKRDQRPSSIRPSEQWIEEMILYNKSTAILANQSVPGPYPCSWLSAGTVFEGSQFTTHTDRGSASRIPEKWNVRVVIHGLDWKTKYVYGQMEAENLPGVSGADGSSTGGGSVITYLEGEIIDFDRHGLATRGYGSSLTADATNWRRFRALSQKEHKMDERNMARRICDREFLDENLHQKYILMRWKGEFFPVPPIMEKTPPLPFLGYRRADHQAITERYFIPESVSHSPIHHGSERSGLTISGFYYVCLTRYSGHIQAFYFDPEGAPHQELAMKPLPKSFPAPAYS